MVNVHRRLNLLYPDKYELIEPCWKVLILEARHKRDWVERLWREDPDALFAASPFLTRIGHYHNYEELFATELAACEASEDSTDWRAWDEAVMTQFRLMGETSLPLVEKLAVWERMQWASIECGDAG